MANATYTVKCVRDMTSFFAEKLYKSMKVCVL